MNYALENIIKAHQINFAGPKGAHLNISWVPKVIDPQKSVKIFFDVTNRKISSVFKTRLYSCALNTKND